MGNAASSTPEAKQFVESSVAENKVVVFSKSYCPFCTKAKDAFAAEGVSPMVVELDQRSDGGAIQAALESITGQRTVPNVFIGGKTIGGGDETAAARQSGDLTKWLQAAGAL